MTRKNIQTSTRIILAVANKDIGEALKNRTLLLIAIGVLTLMLTGPLLSLLINRSMPMIVVYAPAGLQMFQPLEQRDDLQLVQVDSQAQMESYILQPHQAIIGVVIPAIEEPDPAAQITLDGYTAHWVSELRMQERVAFSEAALSEASGQTVSIDMEDHRLYPSQEDSYQFTMIAMSLTTMILLMGLALVPYLFIEEKESHTIDALLVSPAHFWQLGAGKLIAGAVYCLVAAAIVMVFNFRIVVHWELMVPTVLLASAFAVAVGLLLGLLFENAASMGLWTGLLTIVLVVAPLLQIMGTGKLPVALLTVISWLPSTAIYNLTLLALLGEVPMDTVLQGLLLLVSTTLVLYGLIIWRIRQMDR
jgi:ABC-type transport system involved in multi-copper enzyme maturation permease subunit